MITNAMQYRSPRQPPSNEAVDLAPMVSATSAAEALMNYHVGYRKPEPCGGVCWTYSRLVNGKLGREEGVSFHVRTLACLFAQSIVFMWICTFAYDLLSDSAQFKGGPVEAEALNSTVGSRRQLGSRVYRSSYHHRAAQSQLMWNSMSRVAVSLPPNSTEIHSSDQSFLDSNMWREYLETDPQLSRHLQPLTSNVIFYNVTGIDVALVDITGDEAWACIQRTVWALVVALNFPLESLSSVVLPDPSQNSTILTACGASPELYGVLANAPGSTVLTTPPAPVLSDWDVNNIFYNLTFASFEALNETSLSYETRTGLACVRSVVATYLALGLQLELRELLVPANGWLASEVFAACRVPIEGVVALEDVSVILHELEGGVLLGLFSVYGFDFSLINLFVLSGEDVEVLNCMAQVAESFIIVEREIPFFSDLFFACGGTEFLREVLFLIRMPTLPPTSAPTSDEEFGYVTLGISEPEYIASAAIGVAVAMLAGLYVSVVFLPSYVSTVLQFRYGIIPSYGNVEFNAYRYAIDVSTV
jgi:hypothetical protein